MSTATLELRVLMGLQAGARMGVGEGRYVLGSGGSADIMLSGPWMEEQHAALTIESGRARIAPLMGGVNNNDGTEITEETDLAPGQAVDCDGVWISVAKPDAPWPDVSEVLARRVVAGSSRAAAAAPEGAAPAAAAAPKKAPEKAPAQDKRERPRAAMLVPLAAAAFLLLVTGGWLWRSTSADPPKAVAAAAKPDPAAALGAGLESRIAQLGMRDRLAARRSASGWTIVGIVADEAERGNVRAAFANAPVAMRVHTEEEIASVVAGLIARSGMPMKFELIGGGRAKLTLAAPNVESAEQVAQSFRDELGGAREIETEFLTPAGVIPSLQDMVARAGLGSRIRLAPVGPSSPHILAQGTLGNAELERWNQVQAEFARKHGDFVKVQSGMTRLSPTMPFTVRAVLDGASPQVITSEGHRILEGGTLRGYRLVAVRENELLFDGAEKVSIARPKIEGPRAPAR